MWSHDNVMANIWNGLCAQVAVLVMAVDIDPTHDLFPSSYLGCINLIHIFTSMVEIPNLLHLIMTAFKFKVKSLRNLFHFLIRI